MIGIAIYVGTHDGFFHGDDVFGYAILSLLYDDITLIRTRNPDRLKKCDILFDIGETYDPQRKIFDHHSLESPIRNNGIPYASAGLLWDFFGRMVINKILPDRTPEEIEEIHFKIDNSIIQSIDAHDIGYYSSHKVEHYTLSQLISSFLPAWTEKITAKKLNRRFLNAAKICRAVLKNNIYYQASLLDAEQHILNAYYNRTHPEIIVLDQFIPFNSCILKHSMNIKYVVFKSKRNEWLVQGAPCKVGAFVHKKTFPMEWAGKRGKELDRVTEIKGCIFCHPGRFVVCHKTKEGAIQLALKALRAELEPSIKQDTFAP